MKPFFDQSKPSWTKVKDQGLKRETSRGRLSRRRSSPTRGSHTRAHAFTQFTAGQLDTPHPSQLVSDWMDPGCVPKTYSTWDCPAVKCGKPTLCMGTQAAASMHRLTYTGPGDSTLFLTVQTYCGNNRLPDEWQELIPEISAVVIDVLVLACLLPLAEQTFNILLRHRNTRPSGLEWEGCGGQQPTTGTEIICEALASALLSGGRRNPVTHLRQFTQEEWDSFGVSNLTYHSYIKAGNGYYKPPARHTVGTHPQAHAPMYGPTHHPRIHGQFGCIYMLLFWVSALMWWVEVGRETARMQNGNRIYCGFALFMATPLIKPCLLALIALFGCLGCVMATPGLSVWKLFGGEESFEEILIRAQATPVESVKVCVRHFSSKGNVRHSV